MRPYYTALMLLLYGCGNNSTEHKPVVEVAATSSTKKVYEKPNFSRKPVNSNIAVKQVFAIVDQVYSIDKRDSYFNLKAIHINKIEHRYGVTAFDTSGALQLYSYGNFGLLKYVNSDYSAFAFNKVFTVVEKSLQNELPLTDEGIWIEDNIISKGGIVYILKDNYIIYKFRRCNDDWKKNERLEQKFIVKLFRSSLPDAHFFIRACCSCPRRKSMYLQ